MAYGDFTGLTRRTASYKILRDKTFNIAKKIQNMMDIPNGLSAMVYKRLIKETSRGAVKNEIIQNKGLDEELHEPIIR